MFIECFSTQAFSEKICWIFNTTPVCQIARNKGGKDPVILKKERRIFLGK